MYNKIAQFSLSSKKIDNINEIFIFQPDFNIEKIAGKLFIILEINNNYKNNSKIINFLKNTVYNNYYQNEKIILREKISTLKIEHIFESSLTKINKQFTDFLEKEKINFNFNDINITVGIIYENDIHFANTGLNKILLVYKNLKKEKESPLLNLEKEEYKISEISKHIIKNDNPEEKNNEKLFSNVVSGKIPPKGTFIVCNESLPEYFSNKQLIDTTTTLPPVAASTQIKNYLENLNIYTSFYGIIIKNTTLDPEEPRPTVRLSSNSNNSINHLNKTENETENFLSPSGILNQIKIGSIFKYIQNKQQNLPYDKNFFLKDKIFFKKKSFTFFKKTLEIFQNFFIYVVNISSHFAKKLFKNTSPKELVKKTNIFFTNLSIKNKILLALFFFFIILFTANSFYLKDRNQKQTNQADYANLTNDIEQKQNQIEATLLYNNDDGAKKLFKELEALISQMPQKTPDENQKYLEFKTKIDVQMEKIRKISKLDDLSEIVNFSKLNTNAQTKNIIFSPDDKQGRIFGSDPAQKAIYIFNLKENTATSLESKEEINIVDFGSPSQNNNKLTYYLNNKNIIELDPNKDTIKEIAIEEKAFTDIISAEAYTDKIYLLNKNGEINRYSKKNQTFSSAYLWNQNNNAEIKNAVDMSIDGNIFILGETGAITKLSKGEKSEFNYDQIDPPFTNPNKIYASPNFKFLYILESSQKRLAVFDKDGKFLIQYRFDQLHNVVDFAIDEKKQKIYFLDSNTVWSATATHF
jgi:hypothetical protein